MRSLIISLLLLLVVSFFEATYSQSTSVLFTSELNIKFDGLEIKKLERSSKLINVGELQLQEARNLYNNLSELEKKERFSSAYQNALKKLFESSETTKQAYELAFSVFRTKNEVFWQKMNRTNHRASGMEKAKYYEGTALKNQHRSQIRRQQVLETDRFEYSLEIMEDALEYEKLSVRDQGRALQICVDYPVEYNYGWDDDKSLQEIVRILKDPILHEPPKDIFATVDKNVAVDSSIIKEVIFKVQIAAHTIPLSQEYLNLFYKGDLAIDLIYEENWYKYSIGIYPNFEEAEATRQELNIKKSFVVAYCEGKKVSIKEANDIIEKKKTAGL